MGRKLLEMLRKYAVKRGEFVLASGRKSSYYIDVKRAYTRPEVLREIAAELASMIDKNATDRIAGVALGAVPLAAAVSLETGLPFIIVRKKEKGYGTGKLIEGELRAGERVVLVEDVTTTGGSALKAAKLIQEAGAVCEEVVSVVDRGEGAKELMDGEGIALRCLVKAEELI
jgi:orotate phosphoribosyltransferase